MAKRNLIVAVSGGGRSLENLLSYSQKEDAEFRVSGVISSAAKCRAVEIAKSAKIDVCVIDFSGTQADIVAGLQQYCQTADLLCLAGFVKRFPLLPHFENKIVNIHPALLPDFSGTGMYGKHVHMAVLSAGVKESGATVHFVDEHYDHGRIISQIRVPVWDDDTYQSLADRVFAAEMQLLPQTINDLFTGKLPLENNQVYFYEG